MIRASALLCGCALLAAPAAATETISYTYDALGRLIKVERSGSVNGGVVANYEYDPADNRKTVIVTGSSFGSESRLIVVPLRGITVIPLGQTP